MRIAIWWFASTLLAVPVFAEPPASASIDQVDGRDQTDLERLHELITSGKTDAASVLYAQLIVRSGDRMVGTGSTNGGERFVPLRAALSRQLLTDPAAESVVQEIRRSGDSAANARWAEIMDSQRTPQIDRPALLAEFIRQHPLASAWDDALLAAIDLAISQADSLRADRLIQLALDWNRLQVSVRISDRSAEIAARSILLTLLNGQTEVAKMRFQTFAQQWPDARAPFAGTDGLLLDQLSRLIDAADAWPQQLPTIAGNTVSVETASDVPDWRQQTTLRLLWRHPSPSPFQRTALSLAMDNLIEIGVGESRESPLSVLPTVHQGNVFFHDGLTLRALQLADGRALAWASDDGVIYALPEAGRSEIRPLEAAGVARFSLAVRNERLVARMGNPVSFQANSITGVEIPSRIVELDLAAEGKLAYSPIAPWDDSFAFLGTPVIDGEFAYVALQQSGGVPSLWLAAYAEDRLLWKSQICSGHSYFSARTNEISHRTVTLVDQTLFVCSDTGIIAALDANDGQMLWMHRYVRSEVQPVNLVERPWHSERNLTAPLYHQGRLFVAPADLDGILALDAATGRFLWQTKTPKGTLDAVHLLGATHSLLMASGRRLWWINSATGGPALMIKTDAGQTNPWPTSLMSETSAWGKGVVLGDELLWTVRTDRGDFLQVWDCSLATPLQQISLTDFGVQAGHLLVWEDFLLVASAQELVCFQVLADRTGLDTK
ncbi:MAG: PQQ-binding-like beta-propeller repeat protein [Planctomycetales bacterium]|nr:PQQ-binding-like beta-propeller repeat protein [Planctomycetales bacterium]